MALIDSISVLPDYYLLLYETDIVYHFHRIESFGRYFYNTCKIKKKSCISFSTELV